MGEEIGGYLIYSGEGESFNAFSYKYGQLPKHWYYKGMQHKRDASQFYELCEKNRCSIVEELEKFENFNVQYFYIGELEYAMDSILSRNNEITLPDFQAFYFLAHLSIENFLKALFLDKNPDLLGFRSLPKKMHTHNLLKLSKYLDLTLSEDEIDFLIKLTSLSQSYCRYPIKTKSVDEDLSVKSSIDTGDKDFNWLCIDCIKNPYRDDKDMYEKFLKKHLEKKIKNMLSNEKTHMEILFNNGEEIEKLSE